MTSSTSTSTSTSTSYKKSVNINNLQSLLTNIKINNHNKEQQQKQSLTVYLCIDLTKSTFETENLIKKCIEVYIKTKCQDYELVEVKQINVKLPPHIVFDCVHEGLMFFSEMHTLLKLKEPGKAWFLYITNGNIRSIYSNVSVVLLNKEPYKKQTKYIINKEPIVTNYDEMTKTDKLNMLKIITTNMDKVLNGDNKNIINYENLEYKLIN